MVMVDKGKAMSARQGLPRFTPPPPLRRTHRMWITCAVALVGQEHAEAVRQLDRALRDLRIDIRMKESAIEELQSEQQELRRK